MVGGVTSGLECSATVGESVPVSMRLGWSRDCGDKTTHSVNIVEDSRNPTGCSLPVCKQYTHIVSTNRSENYTYRYITSKKLTYIHIQLSQTHI